MVSEDELFERQRQRRIDSMPEQKWGAALRNSELVQKFENKDPHPELPFEGSGEEYPDADGLVVWSVILVMFIGLLVVIYGVGK